MSDIDPTQAVLTAINNWLRPDNRELREAIDRTVQEGLFSFPDVKHRILSLKRTLNEENIRQWLENSRLSAGGGLGGRKILCLHAGNLPLVGIQDALAVLLSGAAYLGKVSGKDPWLLPSFLKEARRAGLGEITWSDHLGSLEGARSDAVLFSGSARSVQEVLRAIDDLNLAKEGYLSLMRTAHYSLAYIDQNEAQTMEDLVEAVFRYGGRGCRSVAVVISPFSLEDEKCSFTDYVESFWLNNPPHHKPPPSLYHRYAYNKAVGHSQSWLDDFLIEETEMKPDKEYVLHWIRGGREKVRDFVQKYGSGLQSVYVTRREVKIPGLEKKELELLSNAQCPPVDWQPDGVDTLKWLRRLR
ncbi:MAG: hypothetical protein WD510_04370 [Balneolaceae bacterium]